MDTGAVFLCELGVGAPGLCVGLLEVLALGLLRARPVSAYLLYALAVLPGVALHFLCGGAHSPSLWCPFASSPSARARVAGDDAPLMRPRLGLVCGFH